jgi:LPS export ABC transporter protein LptC
MLTYRCILIAILALATLLSVGCSRDDQVASKNPGPVDSAGRPDTEIRGATIHLYSRDILNTEVHAQRIVRFEDIDSTMGYTLDIDFYDSLGSITSNLVGDSGVIREISGAFNVFGHVIVNTADSIRLDTDFLKWNPTTNLITTDAFVKVSRPGDTVTGWGLEAPRDLSRIRILNQVSGTVQDVESLESPR